MPGMDIHFLEVSAYVLVKVATKSSFRCKKAKNLGFSGYFSKAKTEVCNEKDFSDSEKFRITTPCSTAYLV